MSEVVSRRPETAAASTTAEDTLKQKTRGAGVVSGGHIVDIYDGRVDEGIRIVDVRHEQVAAHAAEGYARQTGKLGCVATTFRSESPIIHIGGQGALAQHKMGALQRARESIAKTGKSAVINAWVDPAVYAPGTMAQTMYK